MTRLTDEDRSRIDLDTYTIGIPRAICKSTADDLE